MMLADGFFAVAPFVAHFLLSTAPGEVVTTQTT